MRGGALAVLGVLQVLQVLGTVGGCGTWASTEPGPPPIAAVEHVVATLGQAVAEPDREAAIAAWTQAEEAFEAGVEPALRARHDPRVVAAVELRFARIHAALPAANHPAAEAEATALAHELRALLAE